MLGNTLIPQHIRKFVRQHPFLLIRHVSEVVTQQGRESFFRFRPHLCFTSPET